MGDVARAQPVAVAVALRRRGARARHRPAPARPTIVIEHDAMLDVELTARAGRARRRAGDVRDRCGRSSSPATRCSSTSCSCTRPASDPSMPNPRFAIESWFFGAPGSRATTRRSPCDHRTDAPVVIEARGVEKTFRIPEHRVDSLKERATAPVHARRVPRAARAARRLLRRPPGRVLRDRRAQRLGQEHAAEDPRRASTAPTPGAVRMAGRLAPFIELGVGFNPELTARENVVLNGVMMGLDAARGARGGSTRCSTSPSCDEFVDLKLKNYSSGMMVRLAFAVMVEADADIMLDRRGARRRRRRVRAEVHGRLPREAPRGQDDRARHPRHGDRPGLCDRAMLLHDGELRYIGDPEEAALRYYRLNFGGGADADGRRRRRARRQRARGRRAGSRTRRASASRTSSRASRSGSTSCSRRAATSRRPVFGFHFVNADGVAVFGFNRDARRREPTASPAGSACGSRAGSRTRCCPGATSLDCLDLAQTATQGDLALHGAAAARLRRLRDAAGRRASSSVAGRRRRRCSSERRRRSSCATCAGPSALGGGWRRALELLYLIAVTEFKRTYFGTALGYLWSLARPLMLFGVLLAVFTQVFRLGSEVPHYPVLLLFNIVLFGFFQEATGAAVDVDRQPGVGRAQDAVPAARDPARGRAHEPVQPRAEPRRGVRLHARLRRRADVDLAAVPAGARWRWSCSPPRCR